jgi:hypothetical protein
MIMTVMTPPALTLTELTLRKSTHVRRLVSSDIFMCAVRSHEGHERRELHRIARQRVKEPDIGGVLRAPLHEEETVDRVQETALVIRER